MSSSSFLRTIGFIILIITLFCWVVTWKLDDWLITRITNYVKTQSSFSITIDKLRTDLKNGMIDLRGITVSNPANYPEPHFLKINELKVHFNWFSLLGPRILIYEFVIDMDEFCGVRTQQGETNVKQFAADCQKLTQRAAAPKDKEVEEEPTLSNREFLINRLFFRLNQVTVADYKAGKRDVKTARLGISRVFNNVTHYQQIAMPLISDLSVFVSGFMLDAILQSTLNQEGYKEALKQLLNPLKSHVEKGKKEGRKYLNKFLEKVRPEADPGVDSSADSAAGLDADLKNPTNLKEVSESPESTRAMGASQ